MDTSATCSQGRFARGGVAEVSSLLPYASILIEATLYQGLIELCTWTQIAYESHNSQVALNAIENSLKR